MKKGLRPIIAEVKCICGKKGELTTRKGIRITGDMDKLTALGHVDRAKRKQAWGATDKERKDVK